MLLANPFIISGISFLISLLTYLLSWSGLYPKLEYSLLFFLVLFIGLNFVLGFYLKNKFAYSINEANENVFNYNNGPKRLQILTICLVYIVEVVYNKGIPIIKMLAGFNIDYRDFTFPVIHIFFTTFTSFFALYSYLWFLKTRIKTYIFYNFLCIAIFISLMARSSIVFILINMVIIYIICNRINIKKAIFTVILVFISLFLFGLAGDLRTRAQIGDESEFDSSVLMEVTAANPTLLENESLHPLYWSYIYISSPLANFQNTINEFNDKDGSTFDNTLFFVLYEIIPDHITNKIALFANYDEHFSPLSRIIEFLTVGTIFADSFAFIGWFGPVILAFLFLSTPIIIYKITPKNNLYIIQMSICSTILALCTFSNMLVYSSWTLQFIYPLVLSLSIKR